MSDQFPVTIIIFVFGIDVNDVNFIVFVIIFFIFTIYYYHERFSLCTLLLYSYKY